MPKIKNSKILILATDGFEQSELEVPREKLAAVAQVVHVAAPKEREAKDSITGWQITTGQARERRCRVGRCLDIVLRRTGSTGRPGEPGFAGAKIPKR